MNDIKVIMLAGGNSTRLWPLESKLFIEIMGKPLLYHSVSQLVKAGFSDILIITPKGQIERFKQALIEFSEISFEYVEQVDDRGMAGAILSAKEFISQSPVLIMSPSDIVEDRLYQQLQERLQQRHPDILIIGAAVDRYIPGGYLMVEDDIVKGIIEKPAEDNLPSNLVNIVYHYFKNGKLILDELERNDQNGDDIYEQGLDNIMHLRNDVQFLRYDGFWGITKFPWHIFAVINHFLSKIQTQNQSDAFIHPTAIIEGNVQFGKNVRVMEYSKIVGPAYIGDNTIVGTGTMIRDSMIESDCVIGFATDVTRSYVGRACWFHKNYVGDSILGSNVSMGAGAVTANFRLDEQHIYSDINNLPISSERDKFGAIIGSDVRIGVNASTMPGVKIGKGSFISSGVVVGKDISNETYCALEKPNYITKPNKISVTNSSRSDKHRSLLS